MPPQLQTDGRAALILAHGAFHGPWCWEPLMAILEKEQIRCVAVDLNRGGLEPDVDALRSLALELKEEGHRVHAIGHSLGCVSVAQLVPRNGSTAPLATATLLAGPVAGPGMPGPGEIIAEEFLENIIPRENGQVIIPREVAHGLFYHRCTEAQAEWALDRLRPTHLYGAVETTPPIWEAIPVTYIACSDDRAVRPEYQAKVAREMRYSATIDSDHSPMLGEPALLAGIVLEAMTR